MNKIDVGFFIGMPSQRNFKETPRGWSVLRLYRRSKKPKKRIFSTKLFISGYKRHNADGENFSWSAELIINFR